MDVLPEILSCAANIVAPGSYSVGASGSGHVTTLFSPDQAALSGFWMWHFIQNPRPMSIYFLAFMTGGHEPHWTSGTTPPRAGSPRDSTPMCSVALDFPKYPGTLIAAPRT